MVDIPTNEPTELRAGDTWSWKRQFSDYPPATWTLNYYLIKSDDKITITATASGTDHLVSEAKATTAAFSAGLYLWEAYVDDGTSRYLVDNGRLEIKADYAAATATDTRTHARTVLEAIEAVIESRATKDQQAYSIGGRSLSRTPVEELIRLRSFYRAEVLREEKAEDIRNGVNQGKGKIRVRFV